MNKMAILNSIEIVEWDGNGGELECVSIANNEENIAKLVQIGVPEQDIKDAINDYDAETIDIASIAFEYTEAKWFRKDPLGFVDYIPENAPEWVK